MTPYFTGTHHVMKRDLPDFAVFLFVYYSNIKLTASHYVDLLSHDAYIIKWKKKVTKFEGFFS